MSKNFKILNEQSCQILKRFEHPADGWYMLERRGEHPNKRSDVVQILDDKFGASVVNNFNAEASKPGFAGMLIDHDHLKHDPTQSTEAFGWLMRLENCADGLYGQIRWTDIGQAAVDGGRFRFFSTEYDSADLEVLNNTKPLRVRPLKLAGLTLTNMNNNKGQKPITNSNQSMNSETQSGPGAMALQCSQAAHEASENADSAAQHEDAAVLHRKAEKAQREIGHAKTADFHQTMASGHDKIAEGIRSGAGVSNRESGLEAPGDEQACAAKARQFAEQLSKTTGRPYSDCWNSVRRSHPELFIANTSRNTRSEPVRGGDDVRPGATLTQIYGRGNYANLQNRLAISNSRPVSADAPLTAPLELHDEVRRFQQDHKISSFSQAWSRLKSMRPGLFGL